MSESIDKIIAPPALVALKGWLCWRLEHLANVKKPIKNSYYATNGRVRNNKHGSPEDRAQLTDFETAKKAAIKYAMTGIGFAPTEGCGLTILDFDDCVLEGEIEFAVAAMVANTYAEYSPSGNGVHAIVLGNLGNRKSHTNLETYGHGLETFATKNYVTFTGNVLPINELTGTYEEINPPSEGVLALYDQRFAKKILREQLPHDNPVLGLTHDEISRLLDTLPDDLGYAEWCQIGMAVHHETNGEGFLLWENWSAKSPRYASHDYNLSKWDSFGRDTSGSVVTARSLIKLANEHGAAFKQSLMTEADFEVIEPSNEKTNFFNIRSIDDFLGTARPLEWLIKGFLPKATLGVLYGESGSGKSFLALDICQSLIRGVDWNGHRAKPISKILYIAAEGVGGFANRVRAYLRQYPDKGAGYQMDIISDVPPNFTDAVSVHHLLQDINSRGAYDLIVVDTFAQVTPGSDENSGRDMGAALACCRKISAIARGMVLLVHHSGKDASKGARGHSSIIAAADVIFEVTRDDEQRAISVYKQKDGRDGDKYGFKLLPVVLEQDEDRDDVTSCIIEYCEYTAPLKEAPKKARRVGQLEHIILTELRRNPSGEAHMPQDELIALAAAKLPYTGVDRDKRTYRIARAIEGLCENGVIFLENGHVFILEGDTNGPTDQKKE